MTGQGGGRPPVSFATACSAFWWFTCSLATSPVPWSARDKPFEVVNWTFLQNAFSYQREARWITEMLLNAKNLCNFWVGRPTSSRIRSADLKSTQFSVTPPRRQHWLEWACHGPTTESCHMKSCYSHTFSWRTNRARRVARCWTFVQHVSWW